MRTKLTLQDDKGAALPLVLIFIVVLSLSMAATAMLQRSASNALVQNAASAEKRSALVSEAMALALQDLNYDSTGKPIRAAVGDTSGICIPGTFPKIYDAPSGYPSGNSFPKKIETTKVQVKCGYRQQSGKILALASLILTGNGSSCDPGNAGDGCQVGRDGGLYLNLVGGSGSCITPDKRMTFAAGILNVSGAWAGVGCESIGIPKGVKILQPANNSSCPAIASSFKNGNAAVGCSCPATSVSDKGTSVDYAWQVIDGSTVSGYKTSDCLGDNSSVSPADLDPAQPQTTLSGFMGGVSSQLSEPSSLSTSSLADPCTVALTPGIITTSILKSAKAKITSNSCTSKVIRLNNGVFRIANVQLDMAGYKLVGGQTTGSGLSEVCGSTAGAQLQFSGTGALTLDPKENNFLCAYDPSDKTIPTIVAPMAGTVATFASTSPYFLTYPTGAPNSATPCGLTVTGYIFAPGSAFNAGSLNGCASINFSDAAMFKALRVKATASVNYTGGAAAPPPFSGDRIVQLQFCEYISDLACSDLGTVQVVIRDFFARRWGVGFGVISWRTTW